MTQTTTQNNEIQNNEIQNNETQNNETQATQAKTEIESVYTPEIRAMRLINRIALLESRTTKENANVVRKLKREMKKYYNNMLNA